MHPAAEQADTWIVMACYEYDVLSSRRCDHFFKILICGDSSVGKTSVLTRFVHNEFRRAHVCTAGVDFMMKYVFVQGKKIGLRIWDTAGQEDYDAITRQYFRRAQGVLLTYDITNRKSFDNLTRWVQKLKQNVPQSEDAKVPIVLVGNKVDLDSQRVIHTTQGIEFAQQHDMTFFETSCATAFNITNVIFALTENILTEVSPVEPQPVCAETDTRYKLNLPSHHQALLLSNSTTIADNCGCGKCFC